MGWFSTLSGGALGWAVGGPLGGLIGAALGHAISREQGENVAIEDQHEQTQAVFFTTLFAVMGHLAKADGRVSAEEIRFATLLMDDMELDPEERDYARKSFRMGREPDFSLNDIIEQLKDECHSDPELLNTFVSILMSGAYADGQVDTRERRILESIAAQLGIGPATLESIEATIRAEAGHPNGEPTVDNAYKVLGIDPSASNDEIRQVYRRLMKEYHPDTLESKGLPEEMMELGKRRTQEFSRAYEHIRQARGL